MPPPAPYVTLINEGESLAISSVALFTLSKAVLFLGGKTSKDRESLSLFNNSESFIINTPSKFKVLSSTL